MPVSSYRRDLLGLHAASGTLEMAPQEHRHQDLFRRLCDIGGGLGVTKVASR